MSARCWLTVLAAGIILGTARAEDWPQFRGPRRDNTSRETGLLRAWPPEGPKALWSVPVCEGYAGPAVLGGRVYLNDYDRERQEFLVRCLRLSDGHELWRFREAKRIRPSHGITRTVPAVDDKFVWSLDEKCVFYCLDAHNGREVWRKDLVAEYEVQIPPWYNGQCPLVEPDRVVLGIGGPRALMVAFDKASGRELWRTPNPQRWPLSHASVMPAELAGAKQYLWCTLFGPVGVAAADGTLLWHHQRKFNGAVVPSLVTLPGDRVLQTAGYDAGTVLLRLRREGERLAPETVFDWTAEQWNAEVHTPVVWRDHLFAVGKKQRGLFTCLDPDGNIVWTSAGAATFGLGSFLLADGMFFILDGDTGRLRLVEASTKEYRELASAPVLRGDNVWGPMALSQGKLLLRDMTTLVCLEVAPPRDGGGGAPPHGAGRPRDGQAEVPRAADEHAGAETAAGGRGGTGAALRRPLFTNGPRVLPAVFAVSAGALPADAPATSAPPSSAARGSPPPAGDSPAATGRPPPVPPAGAGAVVGYRLVRVISGAGSGPDQFTDELRGIASDAAGRLYAVGDGAVKVFAADGKLQHAWRTEKPGYCVAVARDGNVYVGQEGQIQIFDPLGQTRATWRDARLFGLVTAIGFRADGVVVADTADRCVRRLDHDGRLINNIGKGGRMRGFLLPNRHLDFAVDAAGVLHVVNPGRHRVVRFDAAGKELGHFGRFDGQHPEGFTGCCNPTNVALLPDGGIVVTEKAPARAKVYRTDGKLLAVFGESDFDPASMNMDIAVDPHGHIYVVDTARRRVCVFAPDRGAAATAPAAPEVHQP